MCLQKVEQVMTQYEFLKSKILKMNNKILQTTLIIVDNAEGVSHDDFFEIAELLLLIDKKEDNSDKII